MKFCAGTSVKIGFLQLLFTFQMNEACLDLLVRSFNQIFTPIIESSENRVQKPHRVDDLTRLYKRDETGNFVLRDDKWLPANPFVKNTKSRRRGSKIKDRYKPIGRSLFGHLNVEARSNPSDEENATEFQGMYYDERDDLRTTRPSIKNESSATDQIKASMAEENVERTGFGKSMSTGEDNDEERPNAARKVQFAVQDYEYGDDDPDVAEDDLYAYGHKPRYYTPGDRPIIDFLIKILEMFQVGIAATSNYLAPHPKDKITKFKIEFRSSNQTDEYNNQSDDVRTSKCRRKHCI